MDQPNSVPVSTVADPTAEQIQALLDEINVEVQGNLIGILQNVQERFGYLPGEAIVQISRRARIPLSRIYGVVSFYAQFYTSPRGKHTIRCCRGTACHVRGGRSVIDAIHEKLGIDDGQTTDDMMFTFETVACLGVCALAPVIMIDSAYIGKATSTRIDAVIQDIKDQRCISKESA